MKNWKIRAVLIAQSKINKQLEVNAEYIILDIQPKKEEERTKRLMCGNSSMNLLFT